MIQRPMCILAAVLIVAAGSLLGNSRAVSALPSAQPMPTPDAAKANHFEYKGVSLGMQADAARAKLGKPRDTSDTQDYWVFSDNETAQVLYDPSKVVKAISITYVGAGVTPPTAMDVLGVAAEAKPDGSINKVVKYPKGAYWISYLRTAGDDPMVMITIQKMESGQY